MDQDLLATLLRDVAAQANNGNHNTQHAEQHQQQQQDNNPSQAEGQDAAQLELHETLQESLDKAERQSQRQQRQHQQLENTDGSPKPTLPIREVSASRSRKSSDAMELDKEALDPQHKKIRTENRERKKRWREANEDRNKDNDLRCRVHKRAHKLYGKENSRMKEMWIEEEFNKRKHKRQEKEGKGPDGLPLIDGTDIADLDQEELSNAIMATLTSFTAQNMQNGDATHSSELNALLQKLTNDPDVLKNMLSDKPAAEKNDAASAQQSEEQQEGSHEGASEQQTQTATAEAAQETHAQTQAQSQAQAATADANGDVDLGNIDIHSIVGDLLGNDAALLGDSHDALLEGVATGQITLPPAASRNEGRPPQQTTRSTRRSGQP